MSNQRQVAQARFNLVDELWVPRPIEEVFRFFSDPYNLEKITPPWLSFSITGMTTATMGQGTRIDYRLRIRRIPVRWQSEITVWEPPFRFVDEQLRGPYRLWIHEHTFRSASHGTTIADRVDYDVLGGALIEKLLVRPDVERIFRFRKEEIGKRMGA